jgi:hypothetical protein
MPALLFLLLQCCPHSCNCHHQMQRAPQALAQPQRLLAVVTKLLVMRVSDVIPCHPGWKQQQKG